MPIETNGGTVVYICEECGERHEEDNFGRAGCLVLRDEREQIPTVWAWCNELCLGQWLDSQEAQQLFPRM
jgi:hypothetical protein